MVRAFFAGLAYISIRRPELIMSKTYRLVATAMLAACAFILQISNNVIGVPTGFGMTIDLVGVPIILALFMFGVSSSIEVLALSTIFIAIFAPTGVIGALMKFSATAPIIILAALNIIRKKGNPSARDNVFIVLGAIAASILIFAIGGWIYNSLKSSALLLFGLLPVILMAGVIYALSKVFGGKDKNPNFCPTCNDQLSKLHVEDESETMNFENSRSFVIVLIAAIIVRGIAMIIANYYFAGPLYFKLAPEEFIGYISSADILLFGKGSAWHLVIFIFNAVQAIAEITIAWLLAYKFGLAKRYAKI